MKYASICLLASISLSSSACVNSATEGGRSGFLPSPNLVDLGPAYDASDALVDSMAKLAAKRVTNRNDLQVISTGAGYPVGMLVAPGRTLSDSGTGCVPKTQPAFYLVPNAFPSYKSIVGTGFSFGLDAGAVTALAALGAKISRTDTVTIGFDSVQVSYLGNSALKPLLQTPACRVEVGGQRVLIIRGYIQAKRTFLLQRDRSTSWNLDLAKVASFTVTGGPNSNSVGFTDSAPVPFLQIVSEVSTTGAISKPLVVPVEGMIYIQRDKADDPHAGESVLAGLQARHLKVETTIDSVESRKMPNQARLKYFRRDDREYAQRALTVLKARYPDAVLTYVGLTAPVGQLEVWLPKVK